MQNPQLLEELVMLLKQSEGFQFLPVSQQEMIIRTYESATDQQIERALQEFRKTEDKVEHIQHKEDKLIKKEMKIEQKVEKLEKKKTKLEKKEMEIVARSVTEVSKHQMTIDDLTGEKPEAAAISEAVKMPKVIPVKKEKVPVKAPQKTSAKKVVKPVVEKPAKVVEKSVPQKTVKIAKKKVPAVQPMKAEKAQKKEVKPVIKNTAPVSEKAANTKPKVSTPQKKVTRPVKKVVPVVEETAPEKKVEKKKGFFGFIKKKFFGGKK